MSVYEITCQDMQNFFSYTPHKKKWKREITPKVLMQELYNLSLMSPLIILCPCMTFHTIVSAEDELHSGQEKVIKGNNIFLLISWI